MKNSFHFTLVVLVAYLCSSACAWTSSGTSIKMAVGEEIVFSPIPIATSLHQTSSSGSSSSTQLHATTPTRRDALTNALAVGTAILTSPQGANAAKKDHEPIVEPLKPKTTCDIFGTCFSGVWYDPNHLHGWRVLVRKSGSVAMMTLNDGVGNEYDPAETYKNQKVKIIENKKDGTTDLDFDFEFKGGPKITGTLSEDGNKIYFPDGNVWTKNSANSVEGVYATDPRVAGNGYRLVVVRGTGYDTTKREYQVQLNTKQAITATVGTPKTGSGGVGLRFDFPDGTPVDATYKNGVIHFPFPVQSNAEGNTWTKWDEWTKL